ncbi:conserved Plasmodium membrane protein, unknown function [Plasmodium gonderi]|uniref:Apicoplast integral membrane protein n=1 Tax=Plasmodium gonderi TaxID=77519 RepID=A0A1Y1JCC3_PLAGO|nr:conserved Plasmodium membrane protein, unknown function [Plasmodium gonderi]GAW80146.1 conserved Plasmodium membrane protein, unknown function [Plasmodium gonderi]
MNVSFLLTPLLLSLLNNAKGQYIKFQRRKGNGGRGGVVGMRQKKVIGKCFISVSSNIKRYKIGKNGIVEGKFSTRFSKKDLQHLMGKIPQIKDKILSAPLGIVLGLSNIFAFMISLNMFNLINSEHRNVLIDITDKINSKIFLLNAINDVIRKLPLEISYLSKIGLFCLVQFGVQFLISHLSTYLFYSREERICTGAIKDYERLQVDKQNHEHSSTNERKNQIMTKQDFTFLEECMKVNSKMISHPNCKEISIDKEETGEIKRINMLQHMCILNQSGLIPIYVYNNILKKMNCEDQNITVFINFYVLISGIISKMYIKFFVKKKSDSLNTQIKNYHHLLSMLKSIFQNSYFYSICISIFLKFSNQANTFYEHSLKQSMLIFNTMLTPSVYVILSNILYEAIKLPSSLVLKDLLFVFYNKYVLSPSILWTLLYINNRYDILKVHKNLQLYFLIQAMTPPNYNISLLANNYEGSTNIKKIIGISYLVYLIPLYFYVLVLCMVFKHWKV